MGVTGTNGVTRRVENYLRPVDRRQLQPGRVGLLNQLGNEFAVDPVHVRLRRPPLATASVSASAISTPVIRCCSLIGSYTVRLQSRTRLSRANMECVGLSLDDPR